MLLMEAPTAPTAVEQFGHFRPTNVTSSCAQAAVCLVLESWPKLLALQIVCFVKGAALHDHHTGTRAIAIGGQCPCG